VECNIECCTGSNCNKQNVTFIPPTPTTSTTLMYTAPTDVTPTSGNACLKKEISKCLDCIFNTKVECEGQDPLQKIKYPQINLTLL